MNKGAGFKNWIFGLSGLSGCFWLLLLLPPSSAPAQDIGKQLLKKLGDKAKQETTAFVSKAASKEIAKALGFTPLQTLSRGDRSLSSSQKRNAQSAERVFYATPPADNTRVERSASGTSDLRHRYEVVTEADIAAIEREFQPLLDRIQQEIDNPRQPGVITIPPGQKRLIHFQGYCLDKGIAAPQTQEGFHLLPIASLLPGDALPFYGGLLHYGQASGLTNEVQGLVWRLVHGVNPEHEPTALYPHETQILNEAVPGGAAAFYNYLKNKYHLSKTSVQALYQKEGRELVQDVVNRHVNPAFGGSGISLSLYRQDLNGSAQIGDYLDRLAQLPVEGRVENGSEYTLLASQVAARSVSTQDVRGLSIEIANQSSQPYDYDPLQYIALSTRMTQPVGHFPKEGEVDSNLMAWIESALLFMQENPDIVLEYTGYTLAALAVLLALPEITASVAIARLVVSSLARLRTLGEAIGKIIKGLKDKIKGNAPKSLDEILKGAIKGKKTGGTTTIYEKQGGFSQTNKDFDALGLSDIKEVPTQYGKARVGTLSDGRNVTARPGSSDGRPTLEIRPKGGGFGIEIRYNQ